MKKTLSSSDLKKVCFRRVAQAVAAFRQGNFILLQEENSHETYLLGSAELLSPDDLAEIQNFSPTEALFILATQKAEKLNLIKTITQPATFLKHTIQPVGCYHLLSSSIDPKDFDALILAEEKIHQQDFIGLNIAKLAGLLPSLLGISLGRLTKEELLSLHLSYNYAYCTDVDFTAYQENYQSSFKDIVETSLPTEHHDIGKLISFYPHDGGKPHLAYLIGSPQQQKAPLIRLHSECFTGDLLGSLRCDCGQQLQGALEQISKEGNGILFYLAQEGRGIGLRNKIRAYQLQDQGIDTVEANHLLGFDSDERHYQLAAEMLHYLDIPQVRLMTNNPDKLKQLEKFDIQITDRVPHIFPANKYNQSYLKTKAEKSGHFLTTHQEIGK